jgi:hypothetical protein
MSRRGIFKELNLLNTKLFEHLRRPREEPLNGVLDLQSEMRLKKGR